VLLLANQLDISLTESIEADDGILHSFLSST
jgi:hypothetical protein